MRTALRSRNLAPRFAPVLAVTAAWAIVFAGPAAAPAQAPPAAATPPPGNPAKPPDNPAKPPHNPAKPPTLETSTSRWGAAHVFRANSVPSISPVPLLTLHSWTVHVTDASGAPVDGAELTVVGGMPEHTHGFPTVPEVTALGGGDYRVDGLKFHMPGKWSVIVRIARGSGETDTVRFDLDVR